MLNNSDIEIELEKELIEDDASEVIEEQLLATDESDAIDNYEDISLEDELISDEEVEDAK